MTCPADPRRARRADALRFLAAGLPVVVTLSGLLAVIATTLLWPNDSDIVIVSTQPDWPAADPAALAPARRQAGPVIRIGFVGDILQHRGQSQSGFRASYALVRPLIESFDLAVGTLGFPVDPGRPAGPHVGSPRFNGSPEHLDALAEIGIDVLGTANDHAFDQALEGATATLEAIASRGLMAVGTGGTGTGDRLAVMDVGGIRIGFAAYTIAPNSYEDAEGEISYWPRDWPIHELNFHDWTAEYRAEGRAVFAAHAQRAEGEAVDLLVALTHWGEAGHLQPNADQRRAAHDMIDAGFDLVVGGHGHVLNPPEWYRSGLIAYSLGTFISDFAKLETRTGAVLGVTIGRTSPDDVAIVDFAYFPVLTSGRDHVVTPLNDEQAGEQAAAWALAQRIIGPAAAPPQDAAKRISASRGSSAGLGADTGQAGD